MSGEIDEFRLVRLLGRGGMGEVYLGHDTVLDRAVAIKLIGSHRPDAVSRERFQIEARAIARLSHPNVVAIYRVGATADGRPFLVQELIRGRSLDRLPRPVAWREVCELAIGIARGLEAAHRRGILHRDVKPANVMVDEHGVARLLDFGLAKLSVASDPGRAFGDDAAARGAAGRSALDGRPAPSDAVAETQDLPVAVAATGTPARGAPPDPGRGEGSPSSDPGRDAVSPSPEPTSAGAVIGTPRYMAPELWRGEPASVRSDLYSLGAMLYELLAGAPPYPQAEIEDVRRAILAAAVRPVGELAPDAPPQLARLVMRCLALEPRHRPDSAGAVAHELAAVMGGALAVPEGNPYRGLRAFDAAHRGLFFGRGADVEAVVDRLRTEPLIAVVGDSGIGKSSVCHAGVVPAVLAGGLADRRSWRAVTLVPGRAPWTALCDGLAGGAGDLADVESVLRALQPADGAGALVVIDQLEELVTLADPTEAARVAEVLAAIAEGGARGVKALLAVRGDFLTRVAALPELGAPMTRGLHLLRPLVAADLRDAVVGPARATGVRYETEAMVDELVEAVAGNPGALPLLQFTLAELWQARDAERGVIPARALDQLGGVDGGLAGHADAVLLGLGAEARAAARRIVLRLVSAARTRAVRERGELVGDDPVAGAALESLVRGRLVVARDTAAGAPSYELAHEALIRGWGTLRDWLDEEAGQHAARNRLAAGASEWLRLGRRPDLLWGRRQVDEVRALGELNAHERAFLDASRRRVRRGRLARLAALAAVPLIALAVATVWLVTTRARDRAFAALADAAQEHTREAGRLADAVRAARAGAIEVFDVADGATTAEAATTAAEQADAAWATFRRLSTGAHEEYAAAASQLEAAIALDSAAARSRLAALLWAEAELAEAEHDDLRVAALIARLRLHDPARAASWDRPGRVVVALDRPARIAVHAFRCYRRPTGCVPGDRPTIAGGFDAAPVAQVDGAQLERALPPGSYVAVIAALDGAPVRAPFVIGRGERVALSLAIPPASAAPPGFVYIPEGDFLYGSNQDDGMRRAFNATPIHRVHGGALWMSRTEVAFTQWFAYLRALPPAERAPLMPSGPEVALTEHGGRFVLTFEPAPDQHYRVAEGEPLTYPGRKVRAQVRWEHMPVIGVSASHALAYAAWLDRTGQVPGARLCTPREWEHATRGADGRSFPHGRDLAAGDANFDRTYGREPSAFGPDEVGSFPASNSPYDIADLAGNVWELTTVGGKGLWNLGGGFYHTDVTATAENRMNPSDPYLRAAGNGLRICADAGPAR